jgi:hypothetical protein
VAKFHEISIQASLADVFLYLVQDQALSTFVPLGTLSAASGQQLHIYGYHTFFQWSLPQYSEDGKESLSPHSVGLAHSSASYQLPLTWINTRIRRSYFY